MQEYTRRKGRPGADELTVRQAFPDMIFGCEGEQLYRDDLNKVSYLLGSYQDFLDTKAQFPDMQNGTWGGAGETALFGDIGVKDITKANAIAHLLAYLGADVRDTIAFGDAKVDIPMLEYCAYGVAMGSGGDGRPCHRRRGRGRPLQRLCQAGPDRSGRITDSINGAASGKGGRACFICGGWCGRSDAIPARPGRRPGWRHSPAPGRSARR